MELVLALGSGWPGLGPELLRWNHRAGRVNMFEIIEGEAERVIDGNDGEGLRPVGVYCCEGC